eukprot:1013538_1
MEKLIHFRTLLDKLNDKEYAMFWQKINTIISQKEVLSTILFHHFAMLHSKNQYDLVDVMSFNLLDILNERNSNKAHAPEISKPMIEPIEPISMDDIPNDLISEILSYSSFPDHLTQQKVNRRMYTVSKSPIKFVELPSFVDTVDEPDYCFGSYWSRYLHAGIDGLDPFKTTHYFNFSTIKTLHIDLDYLQYRCDRKSLDRFSSVETLSIDCAGTSHIFPFAPIISLDNNQRIKHLRLTNNIDRAIDSTTFYALMPYFPQLLSLEIGVWDQENVINIGDWNDDDIIKQFPNLEALCLIEDASCEIADPIIKVLGHKLKHVSLGTGSNASSDKGWGQLLELRLYYASHSALCNIAETAKNIRKIHFNIGITNELLTGDDVMHSSYYIELLSMQNNLMYLSIRVVGVDGFKSVDVLSLISALNLKHQNGLKIALYLSTENDKNALHDWVKNVASATQTATQNNFMLIVKIEVIMRYDRNWNWKTAKQYKSQMVKDIGDKMKELELENCSVRFDDNYFMIKSNKYRMYGGYDEKWMID